MSFNDLSPYVRLAMFDIIKSEGWSITRAIFDYELIVIEKGCMLLKTQDTECQVQEGSIIFLKPGIEHTLIFEGGTIQPHVHFDLVKDSYSKLIGVSFVPLSLMEERYIRKDDLESLQIDFPVIMSPHNFYVIKDLIHKLIYEFNHGYHEYSIYLESILIEILIHIKKGLELSLKKEDYYANQFENLKQYILENIDNNPRIESLAEIMHISMYYFFRLFQQYLHTTPHKYLEKVRLNRAKELIAFTNMSLGNISEQMRFDSQQTFSCWFKKNTSISPLEYRKQKTNIVYSNSKNS